MHNSKTYWILVASVIIFSITTYYTVTTYFQGNWLCETKECFIERAQVCKPATVYLKDKAGNTIKYTEKKCVLTKQVKKFSQNEPQQIKEVLTGLSMTCQHNAADFNPDFLTGITGGIEDCEGSLRDMLEQLAIIGRAK